MKSKTSKLSIIADMNLKGECKDRLLSLYNVDMYKTHA